MGPLGIKISEHISEKSSMRTSAALDINPALKGRRLSDLSAGLDSDVAIHSSAQDIEALKDVDAIILTTSSGLSAIGKQLEALIPLGKPIISTCEELTYPWKTNPVLSEQLDSLAKQHEVAVLSTGVNPGFLMDTLPTVLTSVCKSVDSIEVHRIQDAVTRRLPFQKKIGAGKTLEEFEAAKQAGTLRHVGLTESMHLIAARMGWELDHTEDVITPIVATADVSTEAMEIPTGYAMGVRQIGKGLIGGEEKIKLVFEAAVGTGTSYEEVKIKGTPDINSRIEGGVHGDIATCSIVLNAIPITMNSEPGLRTMADVPIVSYTP